MSLNVISRLIVMNKVNACSRVLNEYLDIFA